MAHPRMALRWLCPPGAPCNHVTGSEDGDPRLQLGIGRNEIGSWLRPRDASLISKVAGFLTDVPRVRMATRR
jgi:hypothetical protein